MSIGISTACLYPMYTEQALSLLLAQGFRLFEIFFNSPSELEPDFLSLLKRKFSQYGGTLKSIHPFTSGFESYLLFSNYERRFEDGVKFYDRYFQAAHRLGAQILVLHGDRNPEKSGLTEPEYFERFAQLARRGKRYGITLAQENVNAFRSADPGFVRRMRAYLGEEASFVLDIKQAVRSGFDPFVMCEAMGERLIHVHINDHTREQDCLLPGVGQMDFARLQTTLNGFGYQGDFMIEVYRKNFQELEELNKAYRFLCEKL
jgi:sugar phosphate isomerase/epimerase